MTARHEPQASGGETKELAPENRADTSPASGPDPLGSTWIGPAHAGKRMTPEAAEMALADVAYDRAIADAIQPFATGEAEFRRIKADGDERRAVVSLTPECWPDLQPLKVGNGGELVPSSADVFEDIGILDTVTASPDLIVAKASVDRLRLAGGADALALAVDTARSIKPRNSLEKMMAHQMAAMHHIGMRLLGKVNAEIDRIDGLSMSPAQRQVASVEASRLTNAAARAFGSYQDGMLALQRIRTGGKQTVQVTHVHQQVAVGPGGKAVVAGSIKSKAKRGVSGRRGQGRK